MTEETTPEETYPTTSKTAVVVLVATAAVAAGAYALGRRFLKKAAEVPVEKTTPEN